MHNATTTPDQTPTVQDHIRAIVQRWRARGAAGAELARKVRVLRTAIEADLERITARAPTTDAEVFERLIALRAGQQMLLALDEVRS